MSTPATDTAQPTRAEQQPSRLEPRRRQKRSFGSILVASLWMVVISLVLFFLPLINGLVGGLVGGYKAGTAGRGLLAAVLPAIVVAVGLWILLIALELPLLGFFAGLAAGVLILLADVGLFIGAAIGGAFASGR